MIRRLASLFFVLAFIASAQAYAMPMMGPVKASMAGMAMGSSTDSCKGCAQDGALAKADCTAMCAAVFALPMPVPTAQSIGHAIADGWASDTVPTRAIAPDTSPPRV